MEIIWKQILLQMCKHGDFRSAVKSGINAQMCDTEKFGSRTFEQCH